ncbi:hypothetical protein HN419_04705 [Candidatus Woesearchaeota archaeon]|jgi:hypothetical protein|nr:hypothetical protein [Candidatus Woesearchaeota archaeon]MBT3537823.1 hypothetical protein [Candidatus Woesearchaeota archaeon]MBT4697954.1 hypothetical protein [Candidatus Woesearchaeota archaeon]MBT7105492.1 hypothetical protein [Candidatus Woesearchaeota archaeon]MBT7496897.1 hypothetical protein [Candidatus Woesearchaeota archaeon]
MVRNHRQKIPLTKDEMARLKQQSNDRGFRSIPEYVRTRLIHENSFIEDMLIKIYREMKNGNKKT